MAEIFPDIMGEYIDSSKRFETGGVQYTGHFDPKTIAPQQVSNLYLFLQNVLNVPLTIDLKIDVPKTKGFFGGGKPILAVERPVIRLELTEGEAGLLTLPFVTTEHAEAGEHEVTLEPKVSAEGKGQRIRPPKSQSKLGQGPIDNPTGLNLVGALGATYTETSVKKAPFLLKIAGEPQPSERAPKLQHTFQSIWVKDQMGILEQVNHELKLRDGRLQQDLSVEALYTALYSESTFRFADAGLPLRIGEAIILAKILTYSCQYFLSSAQRRRGLLLPIWERAIDAGFETSDALHVIRVAGYNHILKLSIAISFNLIAQTVGKQPWSLEERQGVAEHIADNIEVGHPMEEDFLYLPLIMGGTLVANKVKMDGESPKQSLMLIQKARQARPDLFYDDEMATVDKMYDRILKQALQAAK